MKKLLIIPALLFLTACQSTKQDIVKTEFKVVMPDQSLYSCPTVKTFPNSKDLTDVQVARLLVQLHKNNQTCKNSMTSIQKFLEEAQKTIETPVEQ